MALVLLATGCAPTRPPITATPPLGVEPPPTTANSNTSSDSDARPFESVGSEPSSDATSSLEERERRQEIESYARAMLRDLAAIRGVATSEQWTVDFIDRPGVRAFVDRELTKQFTPEDLRIFGRVESAFGVIPFGVDPRDLLLDLYESSVLGLYDPERKTLFVGSFVPRRMLDMVLGHELGHGVQDMHVNLSDFLGAIRIGPQHGAADKEAARTCLVEGDAHATYLAWLAGAPGPAGVGDGDLEQMRDQILSIDERATEYPILARMQQLPYAAGTATVLQLAREQGWEAVNALYTDLPETSEQMLHVEKLLSREAPAEITVDRDELAGAYQDLTLEWIDSRGEAAWLATLAGPDTFNDATVATEGWNGDLFVSLSRGEETPPVIVGVTAWDTESDAKEFHAQLAHYPSPPVNNHVALGHRRQGRNVFFVFADPADVEGLLASAPDVFRVKRRRARRGR